VLRVAQKGEKIYPTTFKVKNECADCQEEERIETLRHRTQDVVEVARMKDPEYKTWKEETLKDCEYGSYETVCRHPNNSTRDLKGNCDFEKCPRR